MCTEPINPNLPHWRRKKVGLSEDNCENCGAPREDSSDHTCIYCKQPLPITLIDALIEAAKSL